MAGLSPEELATRLIDGALAEHAQALAQVIASLDAAEAEAEREGWLEGEAVFQEVLAKLTGKR